jgi:hypothetical protein
MSIFRDFFVKEKPVFTGIARGLGGFGFGLTVAAGGGGGGSTSPNGHIATGGIISDYEESGTAYRSHTFITPGTFVISQLSSVHPANIDYLVVGGGGGGGGSAYGSDGQGAGGAGGLRSNHPLVPAPLRGPAYSVSATTYTVEIGLGAFGGKHIGSSSTNNTALGRFGKATNFYPTPVSYPSTAYIRAPGGGRGGAYGDSVNYRDGEAGGSGGGGAGGSAGAGGNGNSPTDPNWSQSVGNSGGARGPNYTSGGGGGFGGAGQAGDPVDPGDGGVGINLTMESPGTHGYAGGGAGGGGGPGRPDPGAGHGVATHGGGAGGYGRPDSLANYLGANGTSGTGGGGGGAASGGPTSLPVAGWGGGDGGPGIVVVRYQIGTVATAKATGGAISFYNNKTIHTFRNPGTFTATEALTCECVLIGGGGGGGYQNAGGGGAGGYRVVTNHPVPAAGHAVTVGEFGEGLGNGPTSSPSDTNTLRNGGITTFAAGSLQVDGGGAGANEGPGGGSAEGIGSPGPTGGSGGGGGRFSPGSAPASGTYGNPGGIGINGSPYVSGGGGGGAGGAGEAGSGPTSEGGNGGLGIQLPTTFRDPNGFKFAQGPDDSYYWVAGGGAGGSGNPGGSSLPRGGTGPSGAPSNRCGGGGGGTPYQYSSPSEDRVAPNSQPGMMGTGGGGGGGGEAVGPNPFEATRAGSPGGSGIFLIAYTS